MKRVWTASQGRKVTLVLKDLTDLLESKVNLATLVIKDRVESQDEWDHPVTLEAKEKWAMVV